jgi:hypothetical protein
MRLHTETELAVGTGRVVRVRVRPPARRITLRCAAFGKRPLESSPVQLTRVVFPRARCVAASDPAWSPPVRAMRAAEHSAAVRPLEQAEDAARRAPNALRDDTHDAPTGGGDADVASDLGPHAGRASFARAASLVEFLCWTSVTVVGGRSCPLCVIARWPTVIAHGSGTG